MIGKRNAKTAVLRNAIKRRIREQFRVRQTRLPVSQYVVRLNVSVKTQDIAAVIAEWATTLDRYIEKSAAVTPHATPATTLAPVSTT
jgi:ribonuclease P protein component